MGTHGPVFDYNRFQVGSGLLDANVARWLGVEREAHGDEFNFYLELLNGDETSARRDGNLNNPGLFLSAAPVPEPATGVLLLGGIAGMLMRRRLHRGGQRIGRTDAQG